MATFVLPLADPNATLEIVGGKGMSLARMARAGLPVPGGFHLTTEAYRQFVDQNGLQPRILAALEQADLTNPAALENASRQIGQFFTEGTLPAEIAEDVCSAYAALAAGTPVPVAVRSSATAEDLPGASFAGQQETYLNICGAEAVLAAVKKCWASLWTARAIAYRARQGIAPDSVALAVVVQELVFADAAGVLFTANPVSGKRSELMITATWGLGEAIVGGMVTPDTLTLDKASGRVLRRETGEKALMTVRTAAGTEEQPVPPHLRKAPVLSDTQAAQLAQIGVQIEALYGAPMDIEWTLAGGAFAIVQARPVTSLGAEPDEAAFLAAEHADTALAWKRANPKALLARGSFAEFVPDPVSPLFGTLAIPIAEKETKNLMAVMLKSEKGRESYVFDIINGYVYVGMAMSPAMLWRTIRLGVSQSAAFLKTGKARWAAIRARYREAAASWQARIDAPGGLRELPARDLLEGARELFAITAEYYTVGQSGVIGAGPFAEISFGKFYNSLIKGKTGPNYSIFMVGFETISMKAEKSLFDLAMWAKAQPELREALLRDPAEAVAAALAMQPVPAPYAGEFAERFAGHLAQFGHILYDLDFAKPIPAEEPAPLVEALKAYLAGKGANPYERQRAQEQAREQAEREISARLDPLRRKYFLKMLRFAQGCAPDREDCIADLGLGYPQLRRLLGELGRRLAEGGAIAQAGDVYWLEAHEAEDLAARLDGGLELPAFTAQIEQRKADWQTFRRATPPASLPEKSMLGKMMVHDNPEGSTLKGFAASAGKVTARACVLQGPEEFGKMQPGDVIVAVTTTPAWTPLFAIASAVVTDIGGPLSHSSIVAREYGIPAVMATGVASKRIQHGQLITVDGTTGMVTLG